MEFINISGILATVGFLLIIAISYGEIADGIQCPVGAEDGHLAGIDQSQRIPVLLEKLLGLLEVLCGGLAPYKDNDVIIRSSTARRLDYVHDIADARRRSN